MYHCNIETSKRNFPNICTTHSYDDKIEEIKLAQEAGFTICSGGIIGMGETFEDRIDMAVSLSELGVDSIPINALMPIKGTPLGDLPRLTEDEILRCVAMFRMILILQLISELLPEEVILQMAVQDYLSLVLMPQ